jgi:NAD(P)-dependent dehydrogenase (short-subunit alcohol dehydrogenase family)
VSVDYLSENLQGKVAIVTGAASGIGLAITQQLNGYGVSVVAEDIDPAVDDLFASLDTVASLVGDVAHEQTAKDAVDLAHSRSSTSPSSIQRSRTGTTSSEPMPPERSFTLAKRCAR